MSRARKVVPTLTLMLLSGAAVQVVASCADSTPLAESALDAGPQPDAAMVIALPDAAPPEPCETSGWCAVALPPSPVSLNGVWGSGPNDVWIVGSPDLTLHWDGAHLLSANASTRQTIFGVWGSGKSDVWAFSTGNAMWHSSGFEDGGDGGAGWSMFDGGGDAGGWPGSISAMWGRNADDVWAVGPFQAQLSTPTVWHCDGWRNGAPEWAFANTRSATADEPAHPEAISFNAIWGNAKSEIWIVGAAGKTRYGKGFDADAGTWTPVNSATSTDLYAVWGSPDGVVWAAGAGGTMRRFVLGASGWVASAVPLPTTATIFGLYGFAANDVWAVGSAGTILHYDGKAWTHAVEQPDASDSGAADDLFTVWGSGPDDVWVGGRNALFHRGSAPLPRKTKTP